MPQVSAVDMQDRRSFFIEAVPTVLVPPLAFLGFFLTLWVYKCCMMVLFQNQIIYMPGLPPGSRQERIEDYRGSYKDVLWEEKHIRSLDGTDIALCLGTLKSGEDQNKQEIASSANHIIILYFQGNGSSLPPRLPGLSKILSGLGKYESGNATNRSYTIIALSYRGYWTSRGRPSQPGIEKDAFAALQWVTQQYGSNPDYRVILWGQSLGAGVATSCWKSHIHAVRRREGQNTDLRIGGLILETPFLSLRSMLTALYPQKWLPYRYLWPFLRSWWDTEAALREIISVSPSARAIPVMLVIAAKDEIVPSIQAEQLFSLCKNLGMNVLRESVPGALHTEAMAKQQGRKIVLDFIRRATED
ncbi:alpha/beta-hydrolase [Rhizodiscina lignyota]|uniref:Alpha/beta-hydrolase n=1 Tax=Rhizodiscina lignyota TaxID=1504668 RepID=A0A9P4I4L4_9PEZI|nr:alpha/beta-hydrolase [Rhizodiscina lignyota]